MTSSHVPFKFRKRVEFAETDAAGIVHFANYFRYMEAAEHAYFRSLGVSIHPKNSAYGFPRIHVHCDYKAPLHFEDEIEVSVYLTEKREKTLKFYYEINKIRSQGDSQDSPPQLCATGNMMIICVAWDAHTKTMKARPLPLEISEKMTVHEHK